MTWAERVNDAWKSWHHWHHIPGRFRMDRVLKDAGVRDLIVERDNLREELDLVSEQRDMIADAADRYRAALEEIRLHAAGQVTQYVAARRAVERIATDALYWLQPQQEEN